jgi:hypothetical protein
VKHHQKLARVEAQLARPMVTLDCDVLWTALEQRAEDWRGILRAPHLTQARMVLKQLVELPIRIELDPAIVLKDTPGVLWGDPRNGRWITTARPDGLLVGMDQSKLASPTVTARVVSVRLPRAA